MRINRRARVKKNKKKLYGVVIVFLGVVLIGGTISTFAWLSDHKEIKNPFTTGGCNTDIEEKFTPENWDKGKTITKEVKVKNTGTLPVYVRVKIIPFWKDGLPVSINGNDTVVLNFSDLKNWVKNGDFYYYTKPLGKGEFTEELLKSVTLNKDLPNKYKKDNFQIDVISETIQCNGNALKEIWGLDKLPQKK